MNLVRDDHTLSILDHDRDDDIVIWTVKGTGFEFDVHVGYWDPVCILQITCGSTADVEGIPIGDWLHVQDFSALCRSVERRFRLVDATLHYLSEHGYVRPPHHLTDPDTLAKERRIADEEGAP